MSGRTLGERDRRAATQPLAEIRDGQPQALAYRHARRPAEQRAGLLNVRPAAARIVGWQRATNDDRRRLAQFEDQQVVLRDRDLLGVAELDRSRMMVDRHQPYQRLDHVADIAE